MGGRQNSKVFLTELEVDNNEIIRTYLLGKLLDNVSSRHRDQICCFYPVHKSS